MAQIVFTATGIDGVQRVKILVEGQPQGWLRGDGTAQPVGEPLTQYAYPELNPTSQPEYPPAPSPTTSTTPASHAEFVDLTTSPAGVSDGSWSKQGSSAAQKPPTCPAGGGAGQPAAGQPAAGQTSDNQTSDKPPACQPASGSGSGSGSGAGRTTQGQPTGQTLAALLALLKAQTLELQHSHTAGGSSSAPTSGGRAGGTTTAQAGSGRGGGGGFASGGSASAATAGSGSRSGGSGGSAALVAAPAVSGGSASGGSSGSGGGSSTGSGAASAASASAQPILQTTSTKLVVTVDLDATMQSEAVVHEPVTVEMPDGSNVDGRITEVSPVAQSTSSSSSSSGTAGSGTAGSSSAGGSGGSSSPSATVPVTISAVAQACPSGLDQAAVSVNFAQARANHVLSVPVTALLATAGGAYAVQAAAAPHRLIPVTHRPVRRRLRADLGNGHPPRPARNGLAGMSARPPSSLEARDQGIPGRRGWRCAASRSRSARASRWRWWGPSGSGKTTLLTVMGTLERPTRGGVHVAGHDVVQASDRELAGLRAHALGFVFQGFHLQESITALDNVALGLLYTGSRSASAGRRRVRRLSAWASAIG